jgi:hypothetical protein
MNLLNQLRSALNQICLQTCKELWLGLELILLILPRNHHRRRLSCPQTWDLWKLEYCRILSAITGHTCSIFWILTIQSIISSIRLTTFVPCSNEELEFALVRFQLSLRGHWFMWSIKGPSLPPKWWMSSFWWTSYMNDLTNTLKNINF